VSGYTEINPKIVRGQPCVRRELPDLLAGHFSELWLDAGINSREMAEVISEDWPIMHVQLRDHHGISERMFHPPDYSSDQRSSEILCRKPTTLLWYGFFKTYK